jgi:tetratricopeptide (TPR) repeat protein
MSLLLDALKKSGEYESKASGLADMQLEDAHVSPKRVAVAQADALHSEESHPQSAPPIMPSPSKITQTRAASENLFAAKKMPVKKRRRLGIVPIAIIAGGLLAVAGGIYVYLEITPPNQRPFYSPPAAPVAKPPQALVVAPVAAPAPLPVQPAIVAPPVAAIEAVVETPAVEKPVTAKKTISSRARKMPPQVAKAEPIGNKTVELQHKQESNSIDQVLSKAYQSYQSGDYATSWQYYREALTKDAKNRDALLGLAAIAQQQRQDDTALHYYSQVLTLDPRDPVAQAGLSSLSVADTAAKESRLKQLITQQPDSAALRFALGNQYVAQSRWADAQQAYLSALSLEPSNALFTFNLAVSLDHLGQRKAAAKYYQQALQFDTSGNSGFNHAQAQQRFNELTAAH